MKFGEYIEATNAATTTEGLFSLYEQAAAAFGYDRIMYSALSATGNGAACVPAILRNYPDDWIGHYIEKAYVRLDPVRSHGLRTSAPFLWADLDRRKLSADERLVMDEASEAGLQDGIGIAFHGPHGVLGVGLASSCGIIEARRVLGHLNMLSVQFNIAYQALHAGAALPPVHLTAREHEILQWCAMGKGNWAISEILHISEHGVDFHLRNVLRKLDADSRVTAVVKGLRLGLINP